jgi:hypothetical protein
MQRKTPVGATRRLFFKESRNSVFLSKKKGASTAPIFKQIQPRLLTEKHIAIRSRTVALGRRSSVGDTRDSGKQGDGCDQGGNDAFHGDTPQLSVGVAIGGRSVRWLKDIDEAPP